MLKGLRCEMLPLGPRYGIDRDLRGAGNPSLFFYISFLWGEGAYIRGVYMAERVYRVRAQKTAGAGGERKRPRPW